MKFENKAIFLDRDGVLIKDVGYLKSIQQIKFLPQTFQSLRYAQKKFYINYHYESICSWKGYNYKKQN